MDKVLRFEEDQGTGNADLKDLLRQRIRTVGWEKTGALQAKQNRLEDFFLALIRAFLLELRTFLTFFTRRHWDKKLPW